MLSGETPKTPNALYPCAASDFHTSFCLVWSQPAVSLNVTSDRPNSVLALLLASFQGWKYGCAPPGTRAILTVLAAFAPVPVAALSLFFVQAAVAVMASASTAITEPNRTNGRMTGSPHSDRGSYRIFPG